MGRQIRILIADNHRLFREGLCMILRREERIQIVGEAVNGLQTINMGNELKPDVVLLDIRMPEMDSIHVNPKSLPASARRRQAGAIRNPWPRPGF
jgi:DNA-binding NarL/FixJ family response regulator